MQRKARIFSPGDRISIEISFACEGDAEIESVEAVFAQEDSNEEIPLLGDARKESSPEDEQIVYTARLEAKVDPGATPGQVALAWLLWRSPVMLPIPGTSSVEHLEENVAAASLELGEEEFAALR